MSNRFIWEGTFGRIEQPPTLKTVEDVSSVITKLVNEHNRKSELLNRLTENLQRAISPSSSGSVTENISISGGGGGGGGGGGSVSIKSVDLTVSVTGLGTILVDTTTGMSLVANSATMGTISNVIAKADGVTLGVSAFTASDFNDNGSGIISIDYVNGQVGTSLVNGFISSTDWTTFNNKQSAISWHDVTAGSTKISLGGSPTGSVFSAFSIDVTESNLTISNMGGTLAIGHGGTGQTTQTAAFDALSPLTTKGDLIVFDGTHNVRLGVGTDTWVLVADSSQPTGIKWAAAGGGFSNPMTTLGDIIYEDSTPTAVRLAGNTTATKKFLTQTGNGSISAVPAWGTVLASDVASANTLSVSSNLSVSAGTGTGAVLVALTLDTIQGIQTTSTPQFLRIGIGDVADSTAQALLSTSGIGTTSTDGLILINTTPAAHNAQQYSPRINLIGHGWDVAGSSSQPVSGIIEVRPYQTSHGSPFTILAFATWNGSSYTDVFAIFNGVISTGVWESTYIASGYGGTNIDSSASTGVATVSSGTWSITAKLSATLGGTALDTSASTGVPSISSGTWSVASHLSPALGGTGKDTTSNTGVPILNSGTWSIASTLSTSRGGLNNDFSASTGSVWFVTGIASVGTLPIAYGGTALTSTPTDGQLLIGKTSTNAYVLATLTATANQTTVTNGSGTITIGTVQSIGTVSFPQFAGLGINGVADTGANQNTIHVYETTDSTGLRGIIVEHNQSTASAALMSFRRTRGTFASPTTVATGDYLGVLLGSPYITTGGYLAQTAYIGFKVNGSVTTANAPTDIVFATASSGASTTEWMILSSAGVISKYFNIATAGVGLPFIVDNQALTGQTADITDTNFTNAGTAGLYRVHYYLVCTTSAVGGGAVTLNIKYTDVDAARVDSSAAVILTSTTTGRDHGTFYVQMTSGHVTFGVTHTGVYSTAAYALYLTCERLS